MEELLKALTEAVKMWTLSLEAQRDATLKGNGLLVPPPSNKEYAKGDPKAERTSPPDPTVSAPVRVDMSCPGAVVKEAAPAPAPAPASAKKAGRPKKAAAAPAPAAPTPPAAPYIDPEFANLTPEESEKKVYEVGELLIDKFPTPAGPGPDGEPQPEGFHMLVAILKDHFKVARVTKLTHPQRLAFMTVVKAKLAVDLGAAGAEQDPSLGV